MNCAVQFDYGVNDKVHIVPIDTPGYVVAILAASRALEYKVAYWIDGERHEEWLFARELRDA